MKKLIIALLLALSITIVKAQELKPKIKTSLLIGAKYTPFDYIWGGLMGISLKRAKFGFSIRNDFSLSIARKDSSAYFGVDEYRVYNYFDLSYDFYKNSNVSVGIGWVSNTDDFYRFNNQYGYSVVSIGLYQKLSPKIQFEIRGDIPLEKENPLIDENYAFPVSISIVYLLW